MSERNLPYNDIALPLLQSVIRALGEFIDFDSDEPIDPSTLDDSHINRHFSWLSYNFPQEKGLRFLLEGSHDERIHSLRVGNLTRAVVATRPEIKELLENMKSLPWEGDPLANGGAERSKADAGANKKEIRFVRAEPTRISKIIKQRIFDVWAQDAPNSQSISIPSPLSVVQDLLTIPEFPGSKAYALVTMRSILFETYGIVPEGLPDNDFDKFDVAELRDAYGFINTSFRHRYRSKGKDKLPVPLGKQSRSSRLLRDTLGLMGVFNLRFRASTDEDEGEQTGKYQTASEKFKDAVDKSDVLDQSPLYEYARPASLLNLPEFSELVNILFGLPIPIRGADTIFRGGLSFSSRGGLVTALHGGPGTGKTSLTLGLCAYLAGLGIKTFYLTAEEAEEDLRRRAAGIIPEEISNLPFYPNETKEWLIYNYLDLGTPENDPDTEVEIELRNEADQKGGIAGYEYAATPLDRLTEGFRKIKEAVNSQTSGENDSVPLPCSTVVVLDGLHEIATQSLMAGKGKRSEMRRKFHDFLEECRTMKALVILTTGVDWEADRSLDYLVDVSLRLSYETHSESGAKPHRLLTLTKARHQLCSPGTHGFQISGRKGVRFTPQMNYQLDTLSIWSPSLSDKSFYKRLLFQTFAQNDLSRFPDSDSRRIPQNVNISSNAKLGVKLWRSSNIFINGEGSGGKAALALKMAIAPYCASRTNEIAPLPAEKVLIVSFLYPAQYYSNILERLVELSEIENRDIPDGKPDPEIEVVHLYPGHLKPDVLFNRILWSIQSAKLNGDGFTSVIIDGIHNVFLQFPEIEKQTLFWPQLFNMLRTIDLNVIITHTLLSVRQTTTGGRRSQIEVAYRAVDDNSSGPLRHALVNQTDFRIEVDPASNPKLVDPHAFVVEAHSAIGQSLPGGGDKLYWSRERLVFFDDREPELPFGTSKVIHSE